MGYDMREVTSIDMKACYPASFQAMGEAKPYFERFGHPTHRMNSVAINGPLPKDIGTGFAEVQEWEFEATCHPVIAAWFGRHFSKGGWAPTQLLAFMVVCLPEEGSEGAHTLTEQQLRKVIQRKLLAYKRQDQAKGLRFSLKVDHNLALKEAQNNRCATCNIELLWAYQPKDTQQFSVDRFDNSAGHIHNNVRLTCLECN